MVPEKDFTRAIFCALACVFDLCFSTGPLRARSLPLATATRPVADHLQSSHRPQVCLSTRPPRSNAALLYAAPSSSCIALALLTNVLALALAPWPLRSRCLSRSHSLSLGLALSLHSFLFSLSLSLSLGGLCALAVALAPPRSRPTRSCSRPRSRSVASVPAQLPCYRSRQHTQVCLSTHSPRSNAAPSTLPLYAHTTCNILRDYPTIIENQHPWSGTTKPT